MDITVPAGMIAGDSVEFSDAEGNLMFCTVPDGYAAGDTFRVDELGLPIAAADVHSIMDRFVQWFEREEIGDQVDKFVREHASVLGSARRHDASEEHSHEMWPLFQAYSAQFDELLQQFLAEAGCSADEFLAAAKDAEGMQEIYVQLFLAHSEYQMVLCSRRARIFMCSEFDNAILLVSQIIHSLSSSSPTRLSSRRRSKTRRASPASCESATGRVSVMAGSVRPPAPRSSRTIDSKNKINALHATSQLTVLAIGPPRVCAHRYPVPRWHPETDPRHLASKVKCNMHKF